MRRRLLRLVAVSCWLGALGIAPGVPSTSGAAASGATLAAQGWWNKTQALPVQGDPTGLGLTTVPTVPAPATVPEDGLSVANDASGAAAIAAVRYLIDGQAGGTFTLRLADGSTLTGTEELVACPVLGGWEPAQNGRWDAKPGYDEAACIVPGTPTAENDALTFDLPATFASVLGDVSAVIVPAPDVTTPFTLGFQKPADADFVVTTPVVSAGPRVSVPASGTSSSPSFAAPRASSPSFSAPSSPTVSTPAADGGEVAAPTPAAAPVAATDVADPSRAPQVFAVVLLVAIGAALWWLASQPQRAPRLLGSVGGKAVEVAPAAALPATATPRGVGRFARPRSAPPTAI